MPIDGNRITALQISRTLGAGALLATGAVHLEQYWVAHFSVIPTIGPLFLVNFVAATTLGLALLIRIPAPRRRLLFDSWVALAGLGVAAGALAALLISEQTPLFGFMEYGYRLEIVIAIAVEAVASLSLGAFLAIAGGRARRLRLKAVVREDGIKAASARTAMEA
jgi:hypothetical protein